MIYNYDTYVEELAANNFTFGNFVHLHQENNLFDLYQIGQMLNVTDYIYRRTNSLLYACVSEEQVEYENGQPSNFISYYIILNLGSSKNPCDYIGLAPRKTDSPQVDFSNCNFFSDFFIQHPSTIKTYRCNNRNPTEPVCEKLWCETCQGDFGYAYQLEKIIRRSMKFINIPRHSIIYIGKLVQKIDHGNVDAITNVKNFLHRDKQKVDILQSRIDYADTKIKTFVEKVISEKNCNIKILDKMLSIRGGSMQNYLKMIEHYEALLTKLTTNPESNYDCTGKLKKD